MSYAMRTATSADAEGLLRLWDEAAENESRTPDTRGAVIALFERDAEAVIVAEYDSELIGSVIAGWDGWRGHLYRLAVRPSWRRRGVASALVRAAEDRFKALGATRALGEESLALRRAPGECPDGGKPGCPVFARTGTLRGVNSPPAEGTRIDWRDVPRDMREAIERVCGARALTCLSWRTWRPLGPRTPSATPCCMPTSVPTTCCSPAVV